MCHVCSFVLFILSSYPEVMRGLLYGNAHNAIFYFFSYRVFLPPLEIRFVPPEMGHDHSIKLLFASQFIQQING